MRTETNIPFPARAIRARLVERIARNSSYSLRAFARDLGVSHNYLSQVLSGTRNLSLAKALTVCEKLQFGETEKVAFLTGLSPSSPASRKAHKATSQAVVLELDRFRLVSEWYHGAIVELVATKRYRITPSFLSRALGISLREARAALARLQRLSILRKDEAGWHVSEADFYIPTVRPELAIQKFHRQMLEKAGALLQPNDDETAFRRRDITGLTIAIDPAKMEQARHEITAFRKKMRKLLAKGERSEVYHLAIQFFPVSAGTDRRRKESP